MRVRWLSVLALCGLMGTFPQAARTGEKENTHPVLVARIRSIDSVFENARLIARLAGKEELGRQLEGILKAKAGPKGLEGIDHTRPFGFYAKVGTDLENVVAVAMIPISDEKSFLGLLENLNFPAKEGAGGAYTIEPNGPLPVALEFRFAHRYAYVTAIDANAIEKTNLVSPATVFPAGHKGLASLTIRLDLIPKVAKEIALSQVDDFFGRLKEHEQGHETAKQRALREKALDEAAAKVGAVIRHGQVLNTELDIDHATNQLKAEVSLTADPKSVLAAGFADLGKTTSLFAGLMSHENAMGILFHATVPKELHGAYLEAIEEGLKVSRENEPVKPEQVRRLLKALAPTFKAGEADAAVVVRGPDRDKTYTLIAGLKLRDGLEVDKALRALLKNLPEADRVPITLDAETVGEVKVHRIDAQRQYDAKTRKMVGDSPIYVAFRPDAVIAAVGHDGLASLKAALTATPKATAPARIQLALARLAPAFAKTEAQRQVVRKVFSAGNEGELRIGLEGGDALRLSLATDLSVLQFMAEFYMVHRAQAEQAETP